MSVLDHQLGVKKEVTYGTSVTVDKFFEYDSESIEEGEERIESDALRVGSRVARSDRFTPYSTGAGGSLEMAVLTKGFGFWLEQMLGSVATTGPAETTVYTHTGTFGDLIGKSFTGQLNRPFNPAGTNQPFLYKGCKVTKWEISNSARGNLMLKLDIDAQDVDVATALATAAYPTAMDNLTWAKGVIQIGGVPYDVTEIAVSCDNSLKVDRQQIRGNTLKKEPTEGKRSVEWSIKADFESMTQRNRAHATTKAGALAALVATWTGPTLAGTTIFPTFEVQIPALRFDKWKGAADKPEGIEQELSGIGMYDGAASGVTIVYKSIDITP